MKREDLNFLPISINITDKKILIIGGGKVGYHKATILHRFTDHAFVISPTFHHGFGELPFVQVHKEYEKTDLQDAFLVYVCTENEELNAQIKLDAVEMNVLASVCDNPILCDFVSPSIYKNENITIAVSSNARNVHQSINIRNQIQTLVEDGSLNIEDKTKKSNVYSKQ